MKKKANKLLLDTLQNIAEGLAETFAPFCEVVVHDLRNPGNAIHGIYNNLSGRGIGEPATELGLARIRDPGFPARFSNYANTFSDGRKVKSTSIGIKDDSGAYVAALCINVDLTLFQSFQSAISQFTRIDDGRIHEHLDRTPAERIHARIDEFAASRATTVRSLSAMDRKQLVQELKKEGLLEVRRGANIAAAHMGVSRATIYGDAK
ncbi:PAS domain-containing protein [Pendulispora brunnea]|uniref:PAS domain-containing protein n=1 Tax=Pendulispora brunnea TaxID=2905690 RepID=A0ABZ2JYI0_9BACT